MDRNSVNPKERATWRPLNAFLAYINRFSCKVIKAVQDYLASLRRKVSSVMDVNATTISVVAISDSHSAHSRLSKDWPVADLFIHSGDLTQYGTKEELLSAIDWIGSLPYGHKVIIGGNH